MISYEWPLSGVSSRSHLRIHGCLHSGVTSPAFLTSYSFARVSTHALLHFASLHFISLHFTSLHFISPHLNLLPFVSVICRENLADRDVPTPRRFNCKHETFHTRFEIFWSRHGEELGAQNCFHHNSNYQGINLEEILSYSHSSVMIHISEQNWHNEHANKLLPLLFRSIDNLLPIQ